MPTKPKRPTARDSKRVPNRLRLLAVVALILILLANRIRQRTFSGSQLPNPPAAHANTWGEQISPADKRALDRAVQDGSQH